MRGTDGGLWLGDEVRASVDVFLEAVAFALTLVQSKGRRFAVDVVLTEFRMADNIFFEGANWVGEHPDYITNTETRRQFMAGKRLRAWNRGIWSEVRMSAVLRAGLAKAGISDVRAPAAAIPAMGPMFGRSPTAQRAR